jgi:predicted nucleic acid-binding protein
MNGYMLDTNVFNYLVDREIEPSRVPAERQLFVTHVQINEIQNTRNSIRLQKLLAMFTAIESIQVPTASAVYGVSEFGECEFSSDDGMFESLLRKLNDQNKSKSNNVLDVLIAETAIKHRLTLVTDDRDLSEVIRKSGGTAVGLAELLSG